MKIIKIKHHLEVPNNFTGKVEFEDGTIEYLLNRKEHRLDGPAYIGYNGYKSYWINGKFICNSDNKNHEHIFYNSKAYKQTILLENMKLIKDIK